MTWITHNHILTLYDIILHTLCDSHYDIPIFTSHHIPSTPHLVVSLRFGLSSRGLRFHGLPQLCTWPEVNNNHNTLQNTFHIPRPCMILHCSKEWQSAHPTVQLSNFPPVLPFQADPWHLRWVSAAWASHRCCLAWSQYPQTAGRFLDITIISSLKVQ